MYRYPCQPNLLHLRLEGSLLRSRYWCVRQLSVYHNGFSPVVQLVLPPVTPRIWPVPQFVSERSTKLSFSGRAPWSTPFIQSPSPNSVSYPQPVLPNLSMPLPTVTLVPRVSLPFSSSVSFETVEQVQAAAAIIREPKSTANQLYLFAVGTLTEFNTLGR